MLNQTLSWLLLIVQIGLIALTAIIIPLRLRSFLRHFVPYTAGVFVVWHVFAFLVILFNDRVGIDVPGGGYLFLGFISWIVGTIIFLMRRTIRNRNRSS